MIELLLPAGVVTSRRCAREALVRLGQDPVPIRAGPSREPRWPDGLVGSITHTAGFRAAAVASQKDVASIGIDTEQNAPRPEGVAELVAFEGELEMLATLTRTCPETQWRRILFGAKESIYKAWFPLTHRWLGFENVRLMIDPTGNFEARLNIDGFRADDGPPLSKLSGGFVVTRELISTAVTVSPNE